MVTGPSPASLVTTQAEVGWQFAFSFLEILGSLLGGTCHISTANSLSLCPLDLMVQTPEDPGPFPPLPQELKSCSCSPHTVSCHLPEFCPRLKRGAAVWVRHGVAVHALLCPHPLKNVEGLSCLPDPVQWRTQPLGLLSWKGVVLSLLMWQTRGP